MQPDTTTPPAASTLRATSALRAFTITGTLGETLAEGAEFGDGRVVVVQGGGDTVHRYRTLDHANRDWTPRGTLAWADTPRQPGATSPRRFVLRRARDVTGVSGEGVIVEGVEWSYGGVHLRWLTPIGSLVEWESAQDAIAIHGHDGATTLHWLDRDTPA